MINKKLMNLKFILSELFLKILKKKYSFRLKSLLGKKITLKGLFLMYRIKNSFLNNLIKLSYGLVFNFLFIKLLCLM